jgi:hypothetical protein
MSLSTVKLWARSFHWRQRLIERDAQQARQQADRLAQGQMTDSERNQKIVRAALVRLARGIADGRVKMQMGDLDRLVRLEEHLAEVRRQSATTDYDNWPTEALIAREREISLELLRQFDGDDWTREICEARHRECVAQGILPGKDRLLAGVRPLPTGPEPSGPAHPETTDPPFEPLGV